MQRIDNKFTQPSYAGLPHAAEADDEYKGYFIPKGSIVIGNIFAIHMDPVRYPDPTSFQPERFYAPDEPVRWRSGPESKDRDQYVGLVFDGGLYLTYPCL